MKKNCVLPAQSRFPLKLMCCFLNALPWGEQVKLASSIILLWSDVDISSPIRI